MNYVVDINKELIRISNGVPYMDKNNDLKTVNYAWKLLKYIFIKLTNFCNNN